jgi:hypothetical protein
LGTGFRFRRIDTAGSELAIVGYSVPNVSEGDTVHLPDGRGVVVLEVYNDEHGQRQKAETVRGRQGYTQE